MNTKSKISVIPAKSGIYEHAQIPNQVGNDGPGLSFFGVGNDIVDLKVAAKESYWQRRGFLDKIFTSSEQALIRGAANPFETVWRLWSMKEAAYKVYVRQTGVRFFNPRKLIAQFGSTRKGQVSINGFVFNTWTEKNSDYVHSVCSSNDEVPAFKGMENRHNLVDKSTTRFSSVLRVSEKTQSAEVKAALLQEVGNLFSVPKNELLLIKNSVGVPSILYKNEPLSVSISISHHGHYGAYSVCYSLNTSRHSREGGNLKTLAKQLV